MSTSNPYEAPSAIIEEGAPSDTDASGRLPPLASRGWRLGAVIIDAIAYTLPGAFAAILLPAATSATAEPLDMVGFSAAAFAGLSLLGYNIYQLHENGQTLGKMLVDIKIVRSDRRTRASLGRILFMRSAPIWLVGMIPLIGRLAQLAEVLFIFRDDHKCVHDIIADTIVVVDEQNTTASPDDTATPPDETTVSSDGNAW